MNEFKNNMQNSKFTFKTKPTCIALAVQMVVAGLFAQMSLSLAVASPLILAQQPAGNGGREPAPNVIISVDDSGSMEQDAKGIYPGYKGFIAPTKMTSLKSALISQFGNPTATPPTKGKVEDKRIRLAWQAMWLNGANTITLGSINSIKSFEGQHRINFNNFINSLEPDANTPSHKLIKQALDYMSSAPDINSPWANIPGTAQNSNTYMSCRRTYNIFMTDGGWNESGNRSVGNADGTAQLLGDGVTNYDPTSLQTRIYKDAWGGTVGSASTLADFTFKSWATDLQPLLANNIKYYPKIKDSEIVDGFSLDEFWNPKNNPATWQHIVTHTIGFGSGAAAWKNNSGTQDIPPFFDTVNGNNYAGDYPKLVNGTLTWPDTVFSMNENGRPVDLWHMALNGRGKFYPARNEAALSAAFSDILDNVFSDTSKPLVAISANSSRITSNTLSYVAGYNAVDWSGYLQAKKVTAAGLSATAEWDAATKLNAATPSNRVILSHNGSAGIPFRWANLPSAAPVAPATTTQRMLLNSTDTRGSDRLDYLRGVRSGEGETNTTFRKRSSVLGDIVNSNIWYLRAPNAGYKLTGYRAFAGDAINRNRVPMLYVGSNDGMLHGFTADTGVERLAYVPLGVYANLASTTSQSYAHKYFVDSTPFSGDVKFEKGVGIAPEWKTYLAGFMGAGGKGYFILDVTKPGDASGSNNDFIENNANSLVILDKTTPTATTNSDPDIGHIFAQPSLNPANQTKAEQFAIMNNNRPALILGNGVNSTNERPVLLIQFLDGAKEIFPLIASLDTNINQSNGLNNPQVIDINLDGKVDLVYAGDMKGNMWKFDVSSSDSTNWKVSFNKNPLFTATDANGNPQPILTAPVLKTHPNGGIMLGFGTGKNLTVGDRTDTSEQTVYAVWDTSLISIGDSGALSIGDSEVQRISTGRTNLVKQTGNATTVAINGTSKFYDFSANPVDYGTSITNPGKRGWYMNFVDSGERATNNPFAEDTGNYVTFLSAVPASGSDSNVETCDPNPKAEVAYRSTFDLITGAGPKTPMYVTSTTSNLAKDQTVSYRVNVGEAVNFRGSGSGFGNVIAGTGTSLTILPGSQQPLSTGWRER